MRWRRLHRPATAIVLIAGSQAGHLLATEMRRGPRGPAALDGSGVHAYVPAAASVLLGAGGAVALTGLLVVAAARVVRNGGRTAIARSGRGSLLDVAAGLFAAQLAIYLVQETIEALAAGAGLPSPGLVLWGCAGQVPVAVLAALALRWLTSSVEAAVAELEATAGRPLAVRHALVPAASGPAAPPALRCRPAGSAVSGRGPPALLCPA
jgi:hypothetical protein